jgi:hypothetical protein
LRVVVNVLPFKLKKKNTKPRIRKGNKRRKWRENDTYKSPPLHPKDATIIVERIV